MKFKKKEWTNNNSNDSTANIPSIKLWVIQNCRNKGEAGKKPQKLQNKQFVVSFRFFFSSGQTAAK